MEAYSLIGCFRKIKYTTDQQYRRMIIVDFGIVLLMKVYIPEQWALNPFCGFIKTFVLKLMNIKFLI